MSKMRRLMETTKNCQLLLSHWHLAQHKQTSMCFHNCTSFQTTKFLIEKKYIYISVQQQNYLFQDILEGLKTFVGFYCHVLVVVIWPSLSWEIAQTETLRGIHKCQRRSLEFQGASTWEISMQATDPGTCCRRVLKSGTCTVCRGALELHSSHFVSAGEELDGESQTLVPHQVQSPLPI